MLSGLVVVVGDLVVLHIYLGLCKPIDTVDERCNSALITQISVLM